MAFVFKLKEAQKSIHLDFFFSPPGSNSGRNTSGLAKGRLVASGNRRGKMLWDICRTKPGRGRWVLPQGGARPTARSEVGASGGARGEARQSTTSPLCQWDTGLASPGFLAELQVPGTGAPQPLQEVKCWCEGWGTCVPCNSPALQHKPAPGDLHSGSAHVLTSSLRAARLSYSRCSTTL